MIAGCSPSHMHSLVHAGSKDMPCAGSCSQSRWGKKRVGEGREKRDKVSSSSFKLKHPGNLQLLSTRHSCPCHLTSTLTLVWVSYTLPTLCLKFIIAKTCLKFIFQPFWKPHHLISQGFLSRPPYSNKANGKIYGFFSLILRHELKNH